MRLPYFGRSLVAKLRERAAEHVPRYSKDSAWLLDLIGGDTPVRESTIVVDPAPQLVFDGHDDSKHDAENAIRIYRWLGALDPVVAMEERLWACMAHWVFPQYMAARWPVDGAGTIRRRYLHEGQSASALSRHGIARLWWGAHLTMDEARRDRFELTRVLYLRQDIQVSLLERSLGKCRRIRTALLDFLKDNHEWLAGANFGRRIQLLVRDLNVLGGVSLLDALPLPMIEDHLRRSAQVIADIDTV